MFCLIISVTRIGKLDKVCTENLLMCICHKKVVGFGSLYHFDSLDDFKFFLVLHFFFAMPLPQKNFLLTTIIFHKTFHNPSVPQSKTLQFLPILNFNLIFSTAVFLVLYSFPDQWPFKYYIIKKVGGWVRPNAYGCLQGGWVWQNAYIIKGITKKIDSWKKQTGNWFWLKDKKAF